jgi:hypothetical protein
MWHSEMPFASWKEGRKVEPSAAMLDSQSVKSTDVGGPKGFDAGKKR